VQLGLSICYDVRFPNLYRRLAQAGAHVISVPSAFTHQTGAAHWHILLRARAIETGCYIIAPAQVGKHENGRHTYGHSLIIDPWGEIIAEAQHGDRFIMAQIDPATCAAVRQQLPALEHGKRFVLPSTDWSHD
jgi:predicted amidohydrolase